MLEKINLKIINGNNLNLGKSQLFRGYYNNPSNHAKDILGQINGGFYSKLLKGIKKRKDNIIVDLGANSGLVSLYVHDICKKVYAIEPTKDHLGILKDIIKTLDIDNIKCCECAISDVTGEKDFFVSDTNSTMNTLIENNNVKKVEKVKTYKLIDFFKINDIERVDFLKMDIEGSEVPIILEKSFYKIYNIVDTLYVEIHQIPGSDKKVDEYYQEIKNRLIDIGYNVKDYKCEVEVVEIGRKLLIPALLATK